MHTWIGKNIRWEIHTGDKGEGKLVAYHDTHLVVGVWGELYRLDWSRIKALSRRRKRGEE